MKPEKSLGWLLKGLSFIAVMGIIALSIALLFYSFYDIFEVIHTITNDFTQKDKIIADTLGAVDLLLIGITIFLIGIGLFELFIVQIPNLPEWLMIKDLDQLKGMLVKITIVVMSISFTGTLVTWDGTTDLLGYGLSLGAVIVGLTYFLQVKKEKS